MTRNSSMTIRERVRAVVYAQTSDIHGEKHPADSAGLFYTAARESHGAAIARGNAGLDSLDRVEIVMGLEEEFGIDIADADVERGGYEGDAESGWQTIDDITAYIEGRFNSFADEVKG